MAAAARCSRPDLVTSSVSVSVSVTVPGRQAAEWKTAGGTEGGQRTAGLVDRRRLGVSWWFLAVAGSWGSALGHESDPPWPFEQLRCNPHALKMATGRLTSSE